MTPRNGMMGDDGVRLLSVRETAERLGVCERTLYTLTRDGEIRAVRIGRRAVRYSTGEIARFIESKMEAA